MSSSLPKIRPQNQPVGVYVHIPFCLRKCRYCDFYSIENLAPIADYVMALVKEAELTSRDSITADTLYFGGGTPSVLSVSEMTELCTGLFRVFDIREEAEVTIEVNPGTVTKDKLAHFRDLGINRVNIGVQSFDDGILRFLGRIHTGGEAAEALGLSIEAGFNHVGADFIYGIPGQSEKNWEQTLKTAAASGVDHISCYMLTCEPDTPMYKDMKRGVFQPVHDRTAARMFETASAVLADYGFVHYEISNFAGKTRNQPAGAFARHNAKYWHRKPYIGLGAGAHSFDGCRRWWNHKNVEAYVRDISTGRLPIADHETLDRRQAMIETIYLSLRTDSGLDMEAFQRDFGIGSTERFKDALDWLSKGGFVRFSGHRCRPTRKGMLYHESVVQRLID